MGRRVKAAGSSHDSGLAGSQEGIDQTFPGDGSRQGGLFVPAQAQAARLVSENPDPAPAPYRLPEGGKRPGNAFRGGAINLRAGGFAQRIDTPRVVRMVVRD